MDGSGNSGLNLDFTKSQLFCIDLEWLGVGRIRFGFFAYGRVHYCHQILNINTLTGPYITNINLPIRASISSTSGSGSLTQICATAISEGGYTPLGYPFSSTTPTSITVTTTETSVIAIRGGPPNYYHQNIIPTNIGITSVGQNSFLIYRLRSYKDGVAVDMTFPWKNVSTSSVTQYCTPTGTVDASNSIIVTQDYFYGRVNNQFQLGDIFNNRILDITSTIDNTSAIMVLTCQNLNNSGTESVYGTFSWQELY
jgi:hypothetical protein